MIPPRAPPTFNVEVGVVAGPARARATRRPGAREHNIHWWGARGEITVATTTMITSNIITITIITTTATANATTTTTNIIITITIIITTTTTTTAL